MRKQLEGVSPLFPSCSSSVSNSEQAWWQAPLSFSHLVNLDFAFSFFNAFSKALSINVKRNSLRRPCVTLLSYLSTHLTSLYFISRCQLKHQVVMRNITYMRLSLRDRHSQQEIWVVSCNRTFRITVREQSSVTEDREKFNPNLGLLGCTLRKMWNVIWWKYLSLIFSSISLCICHLFFYQ